MRWPRPAAGLRRSPVSCFDYIPPVYTIKRTPEFDAWFDGLKDSLTRIAAAVVLSQMIEGDLP